MTARAARRSPPGRDARRARRRPARPHVRARRAAHGLPHRGARPRSGEPGRAASRTQHIRADYLDAGGARRARRALRRDHDRVRERARRSARARWRDAVRSRPARGAVAICQDRAAEKAHFVRCGVACAPHAVDRDARRSSQRVDDALLPGILKTARLGYDGKGQVGVADARRARRRLGRARRRALRARAAACRSPSRSASSSRAAPTARCVAPAGAATTCIATASSPSPRAGARRSSTRRSRARRSRAPRAIAAALDYVGVLCVEFFVLAATARWSPTRWRRGRTTSGHYSIDACDVSQFELQVRTLAGAAAGRAAPAFGRR